MGETMQMTTSSEQRCRYAGLLCAIFRYFVTMFSIQLLGCPARFRSCDSHHCSGWLANLVSMISFVYACLLLI